MLGKLAVRRLAELRLQFQEAAGDGWPAAAEREVTLLGDVAAVLGGDAAQVEQVLGEAGYAYVLAERDAPV